MTRLGQVFWAITAINAALFVVLLVMSLQQRGVQNDGSREMGLFFSIMLPGFVLVLAMLLFHFSTSLLAKYVALFIVVAPGLYFAKSQIEHRIIDRSIEAVRQMSAAVVKRDVETLMRMVVSSADARRSDGNELPVVRALLALGAKPDAAMQAACIRFDSDLLAIAIELGADTRLARPDGRNVADELASQINEKTKAGHELPADLLRASAPLTVHANDEAPPKRIIECVLTLRSG